MWTAAQQHSITQALVRSAGVQPCGGLLNSHLDFKRPTGDKYTPVIHGRYDPEV